MKRPIQLLILTVAPLIFIGCADFNFPIFSQSQPSITPPPAATATPFSFDVAMPALGLDFIMPLPATGTYNFIIDWGDGTTTGPVTSPADLEAQHTYSAPGNYTISITGIMTHFGSPDPLSDHKDKVVQVNDLGDVGWRNLSNSFSNMPNLVGFQGGVVSDVTDMSDMFIGSQQVQPQTGDWVTTNVTTMARMFDDTLAANPDVEDWDVSNVVDMEDMFRSADAATPDVRDWDVSNVENFTGTFSFSGLLNPDVSLWVTSSATNMNRMFRDADQATPNVRNWDVSNVENFRGMFMNASIINPDVSLWVTTSAINMFEIFADSPLANPNVSGWTTTNVTEMDRMFENATSANPDLSSFDFTSLGVGSFTNFITGCGISNLNYSNLIIRLDDQSIPPLDTINTTASFQPAAATPRADLTVAGWSINDNGAE